MNFSFLHRLSVSGLYDTEAAVIENSDALIKSLRQYLVKNEYHRAVACLDLAAEKKAGDVRADGKTPSILHEVSQALYVISLLEDGLYLANPESVIALVLVHDLGEDYGVKKGELGVYLKGNINNLDIISNEDIVKEVVKINLLTEDFDLITKAYKGEPNKYAYEYQYYEALQNSENASIAKLIDRLHNMATIIGAKSDIKSLQYISDTMVIAKDFIQHASKKFPEQAEAYNSCHDMINTVCQINRYYLSRNIVNKRLPPISELEKEMPTGGFNVPSGLSPIFISVERIMKLTGWGEDRQTKFKEGLTGALFKVSDVLKIT